MSWAGTTPLRSLTMVKLNPGLVAILALLTVILMILLGTHRVSHTSSGSDTYRGRHQRSELDRACSEVNSKTPALLQNRLEQAEFIIEANLEASVPDWLREKAKKVINPYKGCQDLYPDLNYSEPYEESYKREIQLHNQTYWGHSSVLEHYMKTKGEPDGYSFQHCPAQVVLQRDIARIPWVSTICEVGFNAGHSALTWLVANPEIKLFSFDLGSHPYTKPMGEYLAKRFPGRFSLILGDSGRTLPRFRSEHQDVKCDIMSVDGGHFYKHAILDLYNFRRMASEANLVMFDDYPAGGIPIRNQDLGRAWEELIENKFLTEVFRCSFKHDPRTGLKGQKGIAIGHFSV